ncbi:MAG: PHB depolymerase family esterase, partial [Candidatus Izemoplasmatales bacterium]|nr:PHB depolymerase family esterase [Candidatus Izemoplasmatales bacterium]
MIKKIVIVVIMLFVFLVSCSKEPEIKYIEEVARVFNIEYDGIERSYYVYVPNETLEGAPLLMMLHGFGSTLEYFVEDTKLRELADRDKVVLVYPLGTPTLGINHWDANLDFNEVDDVGFLTML